MENPTLELKIVSASDVTIPMPLTKRTYTFQSTTTQLNRNKWPKLPLIYYGGSNPTWNHKPLSSPSTREKPRSPIIMLTSVTFLAGSA